MWFKYNSRVPTNDPREPKDSIRRGCQHKSGLAEISFCGIQRTRPGKGRIDHWHCYRSLAREIKEFASDGCSRRSAGVRLVVAPDGKPRSCEERDNGAEGTEARISTLSECWLAIAVPVGSSVSVDVEAGVSVMVGVCPDVGVSVGVGRGVSDGVAVGVIS